MNAIVQRAIRIAAENLAADSAHIPLIMQTLEKAFAQAEEEMPDIVTWTAKP